MTGPVRVQRQRTRGWRMPENTVYVGRPTRWGNPYTLGADHPWYEPGRVVISRQFAVELFRVWLADTQLASDYREQAVAALRGKDLACWCPLNVPCHADVLLEIANKESP